MTSELVVVHAIFRIALGRFIKCMIKGLAIALRVQTLCVLGDCSLQLAPLQQIVAMLA